MVTLLNAAHNVQTTLNGAITNNATSLVVTSSTGFPSVPFGIIVDAGTGSEESILVTAVAGTTWTVVRAKDGTGVTPDTTGYAHSSGAKVENDVSALYITTLNSQATGHVHTGSDGSASIFDATAPSTQAIGDSASAGSATIASHRDHKHAMPSFGTATSETIGDSAVDGTATTISRSDHKHGMAIPVYTTSAPSAVTQLSGVSFTTNLARLFQIGKFVNYIVQITMAGSTGTSTNVIVVTVPLSINANAGQTIGTFRYDRSGASYEGIVNVSNGAAGNITFAVPTLGFIGSSPAFAEVSGDVLWFNITCEVT